MAVANRLRRAVDRPLDVISAFAARNPRLNAWQRDRFLALAPRFVSTLGLDTRGARYFISADDAVIGRLIATQGHYGAQTVEIVLDVLRNHGVEIDQLLDIGANIGTTTVEVLKRLPDATCVAFEPEPRNFALLEHNILANDLQHRVTARRLALSDHNGTVTLELALSNHGDHRVQPPNNRNGAYDESSREAVAVTARTLDYLVASGEIAVTPSTLVSIDVQGHEGHVLAGGRTALACLPPISLEFWPYALDQAAGRRLVTDCLVGYKSLVDVTHDANVIRVDDLHGIMAGLEEQAMLDLLALNT